MNWSDKARRIMNEKMENDEMFCGESKKVEYKAVLPHNSEKYMKTVIAYANGGGGKIIFGIDDRTLEVIGIETETIFQTIDAITNAISDSCEPRIFPDVTLQTIADKTVIVVEILPGKMRPYYLKSKGIMKGTYVRVSGTTRQVADYMLKELILEGQNRYYDCEACENLTVTQEDLLTLCEEMKATAMKNAYTTGEKAQIKDVTPNVLLSWGVLTEKNGVVVPANAYALLSGRAKFQPVIQCAVFKGTDRAYFVDRREFAGSIQGQLEAAYQYVLEKMNRGMRIQGIYRQDVYELPVDSVREIIANAVAHRSYLEPGDIQVALFDDRLEVTSPGMLLNGVSVEKMMEGYSKPRNRAVACAFSYMKIIEKWGSGIPRLMRECREYGLPEPDFFDFDGDFRINMYRKAKRKSFVTTQTTQSTQTIQTPQTFTKSFTMEDKAILSLVYHHPSWTQKQFAMELGWSLDRVKYYINKFRKRQMIKRVGSSHHGHWELCIEEHELMCQAAKHASRSIPNMQSSTGEEKI